MISAIVLTKNEEANIKDCLEALAFCDEIIVIDDFSEDDTASEARKLGAKVYERRLAGDFAGQRNFGLGKAKGEWVLFIDADERITPSLREEIIKSTNQLINKSQNGFYIKRRDFMWGRELAHGETGSVRLLRLARKDAGKWRRRVHEVWQVNGPTGEFKHSILHYPHQTLREFLQEVDFYSTVHSEVLLREGKKSNVFKIVIWPVGKFLENWVWHRGFFDGTRGFLVSGMMSFHSFLAWSKLWLQQNKKR